MKTVVLLLVVIVALAGCRNPQPTVSPLSPLDVEAIKTPTARPTVNAPGNLLLNPSFEGDYVNCGEACNVAPSWVPWSAETLYPPCIAGEPGCYIPCPSNCDRCKLDYGCWWAKAEHKSATLQFPERVHSGQSAQQAFTFGRMGEFGVWQAVGVPVGTALRFSVYAQGWQCFRAPDNCQSPDRMNLRVGIGAQGETDPYASTIVWSEPVESFDHYTLISVTATAQSGTVTVWTYARPEWGWARDHNDAYWDDAALVAMPAPGPTRTARPTLDPTRVVGRLGLPVVQRGYAATPAPIPTRTPSPTFTPAPYTQPFVWVDDVELALNQTISVPVLLLNDPGVNGLELEFAYDASVIRINGIYAGNAIPLREIEIGGTVYLGLERTWILSQPEPTPALNSNAPSNVLAYISITGIRSGTSTLEPIQSGTPVSQFGTWWTCPAGASQATSIRAWKQGGGMWNPCARKTAVVVR